ncbi:MULTISPECIES: hypothetical protein [Aerococcus]|uniref:hypothetical protein n=1 Tax=Aerococcus TaxID=1375 RepID=UPI000DCB14F7|nr:MULTISPECIES: hypothetical protein [Aerococcus]KAA9231675.1 hypothetical protein F6I37_08645 [Aerococcus mictus]MDK6290875.1 hypothetical protein [Aerococcus urinae]MDK6374756.1 hypothetical protein [Aerococcus urinae]MDK6420219.1 hypothetical protein [Aerococcus urinae]MDK8074631.1 hypothetical protein [Aerococcus urinae]
MKLKIDLNYHYETNISEDEQIKIPDSNGMLSDFAREIEAELNSAIFIQDGRTEWGVIDQVTVEIDHLEVEFYR